jgi:hypothetical protein
MDTKRTEKRTAGRLLEEARKAFEEGDFQHTRTLASEAASVGADTPVKAEAQRLLGLLKPDPAEWAGWAFFIFLYLLAWWWALAPRGL